MHSEKNESQRNYYRKKHTWSQLWKIKKKFSIFAEVLEKKNYSESGGNSSPWKLYGGA